VRPLATELVASAREWKLVTEGYLDHSALSLALRTLLDGSRDRSQFVKTCLELEAWLRTIERSQRAPAVSRPMPRQMENAL
jgi:hypothetical protein